MFYLREEDFALDGKFSNKNDLLSHRDFNKKRFFLMHIDIVTETLSHKLHPHSILTRSLIVE